MDISVAIATHPPRMGPGGPFERAMASVAAQTYPPIGIHVALDTDREGAAATRNKSLDLVDTEWVAFLDSDDEFYPGHLKLCARAALLTHADVVYPGYDSDDDPVGMFGIPYDAEMLARTNFIPVTVLARTEKVRAAGGFQPHPDDNGDPCEDWGLWLAMAEQGATFHHLAVKTWRWHSGTATTRGRPDRW